MHINFYGCVDRKWNWLNSQVMDGMFIDGTFENPELWKECCLNMTLPIGKAGTKEERELADLAFKECVQKKTGNPELAELMYQAVRTGGEPYFPTWYRWGYGWPLGRGYKKLTKEEQQIVREKLDDFRKAYRFQTLMLTVKQFSALCSSTSKY